MTVTSRFLLALITTFLITIIALLLALQNVFAGSGLISKIGGATFIQGASQFWVTSTTPTFSGVTSAGAEVAGTVGSETVSATANASGNWSWTPAVALAGDNAVTISSGSQSESFTLTIGNVPANIASASADTLAPAGSLTPTLALLVGGIVFLIIGSWGIFLKKT